MAQEISFQIAVSASKGNAQVSSSFNGTVDMSGSTMIENVQVVGTSAEVLLLGDVSTPAILLVRNLDAANFVELALDSGMTNKFAKLLPGEFYCGRPSSGTVYAKADTAAINALVLAAAT